MNQPSDPRDPTLENLLSLHRAMSLDGVRVSLPGQIMGYDAAHQTATVQPLVQDAHVTEDGERVATTMPPVYGVPVMFLGPARGRITWPVAAGDTCLLIYCSSSIQQWFAQGGVVDPRDERRCDLSDPVALVGLHDLGHVPGDSVPTNSVCVHASGGTTIQLGSSTSSRFVACNDDLTNFIGIFKSWTPVPNDGGAALKTAISAYLTANPNFPTGSSKVKTE